MEIPTLITDLMFRLLAGILTIIPFLSVPSAWKVARIYWSDDERPRNRIMRIMAISSATSALASIFFSILTIPFWNAVFKGTAPDADFGGVMFLIVILAVTIMPYLKWRALAALNGNRMQLNEIPETQNQQEDRRFGDQRRELEAKHNEELDNHKPPIV